MTLNVINIDIGRLSESRFLFSFFFISFSCVLLNIRRNLNKMTKTIQHMDYLYSEYISNTHTICESNLKDSKDLLLSLSEYKENSK